MLNEKDLEDSNNKKTLVGTWKFDSSEGLDEFLQEMGIKKLIQALVKVILYSIQFFNFVFKIGVNFFLRQFAKLARPTWIISNNGDSWTISRTGGREQPPVTFKDREEFIQRSIAVSLKLN